MIKCFEKRARAVRGAGVMASASATDVTTPSVRAETPPQQQDQVPGYFRMPLGQFEVTALYDGFVDIDSTLLGGASKKTIRSSLAQSFLPSSTPIQTAVNAYLIHTKKNLILVDAGTAKLFGANLGFVLENLCAAGYKPFPYTYRAKNA